MPTPKATAISSVQGIADTQTAKVLGELKEVVETVTARRPGVADIKHLLSNATTADIIIKINEMIDRMQP